MDTIALDGKCPICGKGPLKPLVLEFEVSVTKLDNRQHVGGLLPYICEENGHIFFVMAKDAERTTA